MLKSITFGTFYFFLVFCIILVVWVYFCVPETKGLPIEEMDKIFGGNQGVEDMARIADIRRRLGITVGDGVEGYAGEKGSHEGSDFEHGEDTGAEGKTAQVSHHES